MKKYKRKVYTEVPNPEPNRLADGEYNLILESTKLNNRLPFKDVGGPILTGKSYDNLVGHTVNAEPTMTTFLTHIEGWPNFFYQGKEMWLPDDLWYDAPANTADNYLNTYSNNNLRNFIKVPRVDNDGNLKIYYAFTEPKVQITILN